MPPWKGSGGTPALAAAFFLLAFCLVVAGCQQPSVGPRAGPVPPSQGPEVVIEDGWVDLHGHVVATFSVTQDDLPLTLPEVTALGPSLTLATLTAHPVDGLREWRSEVLTGVQTAASLPPSGPGTDPQYVISGARQPGSETPATLLDLGGGHFRYVFATTLSRLDPGETLRVGLFLQKAPVPSLRTSTTYDFRPSGGPVEERETVLDANCNGCHGLLVHHGNRVGSRLCLTCHTWLNSDPNTIDPAALVTAATTTATDPNPLELGRMVHRIHRGRGLPTLFYSSSRANPAPPLGAAQTLPLPFTAENNNLPVLGRRYAIVGWQGKELVPGRVVQKTDNAQPAKTLTTGIVFPRDVRDCEVCHAGARQGYLATKAISRRNCGGCHPDVWFQAAPATLDESHFAHAGGPRADDSGCVGCHVQAPAGGTLYAPVDLFHVPIQQSARYGQPVLEIVRVDGFRPGGQPAVTFRVTDRNGPVAPSLAAPVPPWEPDSATSSFVPRKLTSLSLRIAGPIAPDYAPVTTMINSGTASGNPDPLLLTALPGPDPLYLYTFASPLPATASGTYAVGLEARRRLKYGHYDKASDTFLWPGTGETVTESPDNALVYVDVATGTWPPAAPSPRRTVVAEANCRRCHGRIEMVHGGQRHAVAYCLMCHNPTTTDYSNRPKVAGLVNLDATFDGIEERSVHFKVLMHRIHTGRHAGVASLEGIDPFVVSGIYFDEVAYPNDLRNCTACHLGKSYLPESVPAGAFPTVANETATLLHAPGVQTHSPGEPATPPVQAACLGCHATGPAVAHAQGATVDGAETCGQCHAKGALSVEVAHGLVQATGVTASATFSSIQGTIFAPRCSSVACHGAGGQPPRLDGPGAYDALVGISSGQSSLSYVKPGAPEESYLVAKVRGTAGSVGGSVATEMPPDGALSPADVAAIEAWIANGAPRN
jgi:OmcA/MtrC family decaheme c-type cytochrome